MSYPLSAVSPNAKIKEVARLMINKKSRLAVFDVGTLEGIITASDLIKSLPDVPETEVKVDDFMTKEVITADEETPVISIARIMGRQRIGSVIITREGEPFGIFTERDLLTAFLATGRALYTEVGPECSSPLIMIPARHKRSQSRCHNGIKTRKTITNRQGRQVDRHYYSTRPCRSIRKISLYSIFFSF